MQPPRIPWGHAGYWLAALVVAFMGWTMYAVTQGFQDATLDVDHTLEVLDHIGNLGEAVSRAEAGQRGYLLTGDAAFLRERDEARKPIAGEVARLRALTADNAIQQLRLREVERLLDDRFALMDENARLRERGAVAAAAENLSGRGQVLGQRIRTLTTQLDSEEQRLLATRRHRQNEDHAQTLGTIVFTVVICLAVMVPAYLGFVRESGGRREAEARLLDMANSLPGAVYRLRTRADGTRQFEFLGAGVGELRMVDRDAAVNDFTLMWDTIIDQDKPTVAQAMGDAERSLEPVKYDFRVKTPDGVPRWLRASATLRRDSDGSVLWNGHWSDVTLEKRLQAELQEAIEAANAASRAKSTFLATMSHEIRTPMNGVLGMLELLGLTKLDVEQRTTLGIIRESGRSLLRIIDDILDFSKIEAGKLEVRAEPVSLKEVVDRVCNIYMGNASSKGLVLKRSFDPAIVEGVMVDPLRLQQILNNFTSNAIKFTTRGEVEVRADLLARREGEVVVRFSVRDTGIGVSREEQEKLFAPFIQASGRTAQRYGGTGLGLAICRRLAKMMGGDISMQSEVGRGTTLCLTLPMPVAELPAERGAAADPASIDAAIAAAVGSANPPSAEAARKAGRLVLVVDDHPINRLVLLKQVNALGYAGELAENGRQALSAWSRGGIAAVITDCHMPEIDGYELARRIREREAHRGAARVPIIACTANALDGEAENCFAAGMDDYLAKPIDLVQLAGKLRQWLPFEGDEPRPSHAAPGAPLPPAVSAYAGGVIDPSALAEVSGGDAALERELLQQFRRYNSDDGRLLRSAIGARDLAEVTHISHRMKGAGKTIGAMGLARECDRIERAARAGDWDGVMSHMDGFGRELEVLDSHLAAIEVGREGP